MFQCRHLKRTKQKLTINHTISYREKRHITRWGEENLFQWQFMPLEEKSSAELYWYGSAPQTWLQTLNAGCCPAHANVHFRLHLWSQCTLLDCGLCAWSHTRTNTHRMRDCHLCRVPLADVRHSWACLWKPRPHTHITPAGGSRGCVDENCWRFLTRQGWSRAVLHIMMRPLCMATGLTAVTHKPCRCKGIPSSWTGRSNQAPLP